MAIVLDGSNLTTTGVLNSKTAVASTSGTSIDFNSIPAGTKRITVMFNAVSTSGTSQMQIQLGDSGGIETTGYTGSYANIASASAAAVLYTGAGYLLGANVASNTFTGSVVLTQLSGTTWIGQGLVAGSTALYMWNTAGGKTLSDVLTQVRITTVNGTDTFDAGSINILYE